MAGAAGTVGASRGRGRRKEPRLLSNLYMRRFILGWKVLGYARRFCAEIVNYADDFCVLGKAAATEMLEAVKQIMEELKLPVNERKTRCLRCPEEALELGYRIGRNYELHRDPPQPGERWEHLPQDQRVDGAEERCRARWWNT